MWWTSTGATDPPEEKVKVRTGERQIPNPDPLAHLAISGTWAGRKGCRVAVWDARLHAWSGAAAPAKFIGVA